MFRNQSKQFDWQMFWIRQVLFLAVPPLIAVSTLRRETNISVRGIAAILMVQLSLTVFNVAWTFHKTDIEDRAAKLDHRV
jgi:hypothetical protein